MPQVHEAHTILAKSTFPCRLGQLLLPESFVPQPVAANGECRGTRCGCDKNAMGKNDENTMILVLPQAQRVMGRRDDAKAEPWDREIACLPRSRSRVVCAHGPHLAHQSSKKIPHRPATITCAKKVLSGVGFD